MIYLSEEWKREQWRNFEETQLAGDSSDCGGWGWDPPCGGCARCMAAQFSYYLMKEEGRARTIEAAGLRAAPPDLVTLEWEGGMSAGHDSYACWCSKERTELGFPWEKKAGAK